MIRIDFLIHDVNASLRNDFFIDIDNESGVDNVARDSPFEFFLLFHTCDGQCSQS